MASENTPPDNPQMIPEQPPSTPKQVEIKKVAAGNGVIWLSRAWWIFKQSPGVWIGCLLTMMFLLSLLSLVPVAAPLAQILIPVFTAGLMLGSQKTQQHQPMNFDHLFAGFKQNLNPLLLVGFIYLLCAFISFLIAESIVSALGYVLSPITPEMLSKGSLTTEQLLDYLIPMSLISLLMMAFMLPVFMAYWFAPALIILAQCDPINALKHSFKACLTNMPAFLIYGLVGLAYILAIFVALSLLLAILPSLVVLLLLATMMIFLSVFYASMYTSFEDIFGEQLPINKDAPLSEGDDDNHSDSMLA